MIHKLASGKRRIRRFASRALSRSLVLLYHRIAEASSDPQMLCVSPEHFSEHLDVIKKAYHSLSLRQLSKSVREARVPHQGIVITFDDGYADNLHNAKPLLEQHGLPATVFVVSGWVNSSREFFWDDLARIFLEAPNLPKQLELEIAGKQRIWNFMSGNLPEWEPDSGHSMWNVHMVGTPSLRQKAYQELALLIRDLHPREREELLNQIADWAGVSSHGRKEYFALNTDELRRLGEGDLIEIGAHTVSHVRLSQMSPVDQYDEIMQSKRQLEDLLSRPVDSFSYPFGTHSDYAAASVQAVREAGFVSACSNFEDWVHRWTNLYEIPRFIVRDWDGEEFERHLSMWW